jgi:hypothetical protein
LFSSEPPSPAGGAWWEGVSEFDCAGSGDGVAGLGAAGAAAFLTGEDFFFAADFAFGADFFADFFAAFFAFFFIVFFGADFVLRAIVLFFFTAYFLAFFLVFAFFPFFLRAALAMIDLLTVLPRHHYGDAGVRLKAAASPFAHILRRNADSSRIIRVLGQDW